MKKDWKKLLPFGLLLIWMGVIFALSAQDGTQSGQTSGFVMDMLLRILPHGLPAWTGMDSVEALHGAIRTAAHFTEFAILGALAFWALSGVCPNGAWAAAFALSSLYAALDEWHQAYVPGRACQVKDWLVDSCGAMTGIACAAGLVALFFAILRRQKPERN